MNLCKVAFSAVLLTFSLLLAPLLLTPLQINAQPRTVIGGNIVNSALTGTAVGLSVMGLQNDPEIAPLRIGLGSGILIGVGLAAYDLSDAEGGELVVSGLMNDGQNTSVIILLDTIYGGALGAAIGSATALIANEPQVEGLQYGGSAGIMTGFAFGLLDAFTMSQRRVRQPAAFFQGSMRRGINSSKEIHASTVTQSSPIDAKNVTPGFVTMYHKELTIGLVSPSLYVVPDFNKASGKTYVPGFSLFTIQATF